MAFYSKKIIIKIKIVFLHSTKFVYTSECHTTQYYNITKVYATKQTNKNKLKKNYL